MTARRPPADARLAVGAAAPLPRVQGAASLRTMTLDFRGFDSIIILVLRGGIPRPEGDFLETLRQGIVVWRFLVRRLAVVVMRPNPLQRQSLVAIRITTLQQVLELLQPAAPSRSSLITAARGVPCSSRRRVTRARATSNSHNNTSVRREAHMGARQHFALSCDIQTTKPCTRWPTGCDLNA